VTAEFGIQSQQLSGCHYSLHIYPSDIFQDVYVNNNPLWYTLIVVGIFGFLVSLFSLYDLVGRRRHAKILVEAARNNALVDNLFPANVRDRVLENKNDSNHYHRHNLDSKKSRSRSSSRDSDTALLMILPSPTDQTVLTAGGSDTTTIHSQQSNPTSTGTSAAAADSELLFLLHKSKPIADLFANWYVYREALHCISS
jgi:hypothetical protein